jgi:hypothetical protein
LALYADDTAVIATSQQPPLFVNSLESYLSDLERWLGEWRIVFNISKSTGMHFAKAGWCNPKPRSVQLFGHPNRWVDTARYLEVTHNRRLTWSPDIDQVSKKAAQRLGVLGTFLNKRSGPSIRNGVLLYKQLIRPKMDYACPI